MGIFLQNKVFLYIVFSLETEKDHEHVPEIQFIQGAGTVASDSNVSWIEDFFINGEKKRLSNTNLLLQLPTNGDK